MHTSNPRGYGRRRPRRYPIHTVLLVLLAGLAAACQADPEAGRSPALGPVDGMEMPPTDLERVAVGDPAPLFTLESYHGEPVSLEDYRGEKNVVLVFYRGHW